MNSATNMTITENLFEDESAHSQRREVTEHSGTENGGAAAMDEADMSFSNASFHHVYSMFDDKLNK